MGRCTLVSSAMSLVRMGILLRDERSSCVSWRLDGRIGVLICQHKFACIHYEYFSTSFDEG